MIGKRSLALFLVSVSSRALLSIPSRALVTSAILTALRSRSTSIQAMSSSSSQSSSSVRICKATDKVSFINSSVAKAIDESLMGVPGFSLDQLMELAGLSVATAVHDFYLKQQSTGRRRILILAGPGNNGGDGLVAARHLKHFGYDCYVVYPKKSAGQLFTNLVHQCEDLNISVHNDLASATSAAASAAAAASDTKVAATSSSICPDFGQFDMVVDALFGFSFEGPPREPFASMIASMASTSVSVLSIDVPSGWHVEKGDVHDTKLIPAAVVSLTAPKECMKSYTGRHYVGGRFIPPAIIAQYDLSLPDYGFGSSQVALLDSGHNGSIDESGKDDTTEMDGRITLGNGDNQITALFVTASSSEEAKKIAHGLLDRKIVACVNMLPQITSVYTWEGKVEESQEVMMIIKTRKSLVTEVTQAVKSLHSYTVPETIAFPVIGGNNDYIQWVKSSTNTNSDSSTSK